MAKGKMKSGQAATVTPEENTALEVAERYDQPQYGKHSAAGKPAPVKTERAMPGKAEMTVLIDNIAAEDLHGEWGLSILVTADNRKILLDTGAGSLFAQNAESLGIDLSEVAFGVLSHAHYDHADGMDTFFERNRSAPFFVREGTCENCYGRKEGVRKYIGIRRGILADYESRIRYIKGVCEIADGIWLIPHRKADYSSIALRNDLYTIHNGTCRPDDFAHEQTLVIDTGKGLIVLNSCSHTGMANVLADIREFLGRDDIYAYVGGLHLYNLTDEELDVMCEEIKQTSIVHILTGHCTGDHAFSVLKAGLGERIEQFASGFSYRF